MQTMASLYQMLNQPGSLGTVIPETKREQISKCLCNMQDKTFFNVATKVV